MNGHCLYKIDYLWRPAGRVRWRTVRSGRPLNRLGSKRFQQFIGIQVNSGNSFPLKRFMRFMRCPRLMYSLEGLGCFSLSPCGQRIGFNWFQLNIIIHIQPCTNPFLRCDPQLLLSPTFIPYAPRLQTLTFPAQSAGKF